MDKMTESQETTNTTLALILKKLDILEDKIIHGNYLSNDTRDDVRSVSRQVSNLADEVKRRI